MLFAPLSPPRKPFHVSLTCVVCIQAMDETTQAAEEKQCRICLDGEDPDLGRLIRPCLCKGSISYVHVKCLHRWRNASASPSAFYSCQQCGYRYHFARTRVVGIATNPVVVGTISAIVFTIIVLCSSFLTSSLLSDEPSESYFFVTPWDIFRNLVNATVRILTDGQMDGSSFLKSSSSTSTSGPPSLFRRFIRRFLLGLPVVGAGSVIHMLMSVPFPMQWFRYRARRGGRDSRDIATLVVVVVVLFGAARALLKVYQLTENVVKRVLLRAEEAIVEVN
ncbi:hypothetical protein NLI96_g11486 [Meripilus lineatus]|uniref:RING-CH-type domain-containing protein n=1 Tax=Meripilus lineatus TaxID=2056292 RepID=A0AAD5URP4_9APHY|nr:hypothetical protein NLI96_g11486 [Physisporinus lineatus]